MTSFEIWHLGEDPKWDPYTKQPPAVCLPCSQASGSVSCGSWASFGCLEIPMDAGWVHGWGIEHETDPRLSPDGLHFSIRHIHRRWAMWKVTANEGFSRSKDVWEGCEWSHDAAKWVGMYTIAFVDCENKNCANEVFCWVEVNLFHKVIGFCVLWLWAWKISRRGSWTCLVSRVPPGQASRVQVFIVSGWVDLACVYFTCNLILHQPEVHLPPGNRYKVFDHISWWGELWAVRGVRKSLSLFCLWILVQLFEPRKTTKHYTIPTVFWPIPPKGPRFTPLKWLLLPISIQGTSGWRYTHHECKNC